MNYNFVAFAGQKQNGKDECAKALVASLSRRGVYWPRIGFGDVGKLSLCQLLAVSRAWLEAWKNRNEPPPGWKQNVRTLLTWYLEGMRAFNPGVWAARLFDESRYGVIADLRDLGDASAVVAHGGFNVLVWRPGHENEIDHPSETSLTPARKALAVAGVRGWLTPEHISLHPDVRHFSYFFVNDSPISAILDSMDEIADHAVQGSQ